MFIVIYNCKCWHDVVHREAVTAESPVAAAETAVAGDEPVEEKQMSLDEWKNLQVQSKMKATFNVRQANEGCSDPTWKKMFQLKKKGEDEEEEEEDEEEDVSVKGILLSSDLINWASLLIVWRILAETIVYVNDGCIRT